MKKFATLLAIGDKPLEIERVDLPLEFANTPERLVTFLGVILPRLLVLDRDEQPIVTPAQFATQCVAILEAQIELAHVAKI